MEKYFEERGESDITVINWQDKAEEEIFYGYKVLREKTIDLIFNVKNNPFVKTSPTVKNYKLIANTGTYLHHDDS